MYRVSELNTYAVRRDARQTPVASRRVRPVPSRPVGGKIHEDGWMPIGTRSFASLYRAFGSNFGARDRSIEDIDRPGSWANECMNEWNE